MDALPCAPLLAKLNDEELTATCGKPVDTEECLREAGCELIEKGAQWLLITCGKMDAWLLNDIAAWRFTPPAVEALNAVGSGDATMGRYHCWAAPRSAHAGCRSTRDRLWLCGCYDAHSGRPGR
jgi:fructose-1-phosphate kinase PfkB-like protein